MFSGAPYNKRGLIKYYCATIWQYFTAETKKIEKKKKFEEKKIWKKKAPKNAIGARL